MDTFRVRKFCVLILIMVGCVNSDVAEDKKQCQSKLVGLAPCLDFVSGEAKVPALTCCNELRKDINKTKLCLCVLVKDRNDPELGFNLNATLALSLPSMCHAPANATECPALLDLDPKSPEAQVFEQFSSISNNVTGINYSSSANRSRKEWLSLWTACGFSLWLLVSVLINST